MEQNREIIRQLYIQTAARKQPETGSRTQGNSFTEYTVSARPMSLKAFEDFFAAVSEAFPDYELYLDNLVARGDRVMARYTIAGTHKGNFLGVAPTNEKMTITGIDIFRLNKGKVIQHWDAAHQICAAPLFGKPVNTAPAVRRSCGAAAALTGKKELSLST